MIGERGPKSQDDYVREFHGAKARLEGRANNLREGNLTAKRIDEFEEAYADLRIAAGLLMTVSRRRAKRTPGRDEAPTEDEHIAEVISINRNAEA